MPAIERTAASIDDTANDATTIRGASYDPFAGDSGDDVSDADPLEHTGEALQ